MSETLDDLIERDEAERAGNEAAEAVVAKFRELLAGVKFKRPDLDAEILKLTKQLEEARAKAIEECIGMTRSIAQANRELHAQAPELTWTRLQVAEEFDRLEKSLRSLLSGSAK